MPALNVSGKLVRRLAEIAEATGSSEFYTLLAKFLAETLRCKRWLVMRYSSYAAPAFIANGAMTKDAVDSYLQGLYRLDPLLRLVRSGTRDGVFVLSHLHRDKQSSAYFDRIFQMSLIYDEAAVLLATPGNSSLAICVERAARRFSVRDRDTLRTLHPLIRSLHHVYLDRVFSVSSYKSEAAHHGRAKDAVLILDKQNETVYRNEQWKMLERQRKIPDLEMVRISNGGGAHPLGPDHVLHWEELGENFAVAPGGRICTIETPSPGYINISFADSLCEFQERYRLTRRECDIVELVLQGYPNARIAQKLRLTEGTVRNYRHRLYCKLDITTERELFFLFIGHLLGREDLSPTSEIRMAAD